MFHCYYALFCRVAQVGLPSLSHLGIHATEQLITSHFIWPGIGCWPEHVCSVSAPRCIAILSHRYQPLPALTLVLTTSTSILLNPSHIPEDTPICSPASIVSPVGLKPSIPRYHSWECCRNIHLCLNCLLWYPFNDVHTQRTPVWVWTLHSPHAASRYQAHHQWTGRTSSPSVSSRLLWKHKLTRSTGLSHYPWCYLAFVLSSRKTSTAPPQSSCYGTTLRLPGRYFSASSLDIGSTLYIQRLRSTMQQLHAPFVCPHHRTVHIPDSLTTCTHVFFSYDAISKPLQQPCDGPY